MDITVNYEAQLRSARGTGQEVLDVPDGCSLLQLLQQAAQQDHGRLRDRLLTPQGQPQPGILLFVNEQSVTAAAAASYVLQPGDAVLLYPPISGG